MTVITIARHARIKSASIHVVQMIPVAAISKPITMESLKDRSHDVRCRTTMLFFEPSSPNAISLRNAIGGYSIRLSSVPSSQCDDR